MIPTISGIEAFIGSFNYLVEASSSPIKYVMSNICQHKQNMFRVLESTSNDEDSSENIKSENSGIKTQEQFLSRIKSVNSVKMLPIVKKQKDQKKTFKEDSINIDSHNEAPVKLDKVNILDLIDRNPYPHLSLTEKLLIVQKPK